MTTLIVGFIACPLLTGEGTDRIELTLRLGVQPPRDPVALEAALGPGTDAGEDDARSRS
jgi:hypothetical protein